MMDLLLLPKEWEQQFRKQERKELQMSFPTSFPDAGLVVVLSAMRGGDVAKRDLVEGGYDLAGYALGQAFPASSDPEPAPVALRAPKGQSGEHNLLPWTEKDHEQLLGQLEKVHRSRAKASAPGGTAAAVNWGDLAEKLIRFLPMIISLFK